MSRFPQATSRRIRRQQAFSLVEVAFALGLFSFALVALLGLFTLGLKTSKQSESEIDASHLASVLLAARRASPLEISETAIPPLDTETKVDLLVTADGHVTSDQRMAAYRVEAEVIHPPAPAGDDLPWRVANVHLLFFEPAEAAPTSANACYEIVTFLPYLYTAQ